MGCNESWYNAYYTIRATFGLDRCKEMSGNELNLLVELADSMSDAFYKFLKLSTGQHLRTVITWQVEL